MLPIRDPSQNKLPTQTEIQGWKKYSKQMGRKRKSGLTILISDKIGFKTKAIKRDQAGHFIMLKGRIHQQDINIVNIYASNIGAMKCIRKILEDFKTDIDSNTLIVRGFNTPLSKMDRSSKQYINTDIVSLNNTLDEMDVTDIYRELFIPKKQNTHSFQVSMELFQR